MLVKEGKKTGRERGMEGWRVFGFWFDSIGSAFLLLYVYYDIPLLLSLYLGSVCSTCTCIIIPVSVHKNCIFRLVERAQMLDYSVYNGVGN